MRKPAKAKKRNREREPEPEGEREAQSAASKRASERERAASKRDGETRPGLRMELGSQGDHLHGALVCPDGTVTAKTIEHALRGALWKHIEPRAHWQG